MTREPLKDGDVITPEIGVDAGKPFIYGTWSWPCAADLHAKVRTLIPYHGSPEASQLELLKTLAHERHAAHLDALLVISKQHEQLKKRAKAVPA